MPIPFIVVIAFAGLSLLWPPKRPPEKPPVAVFDAYAVIVQHESGAGARTG